MSDAFYTLIVRASDAPLARQISASFGKGGENMWITPLSTTGNLPASHYISSGYIPEQFVYLLSDGDALYTLAQQANITCTKSNINALLSASDITSEEPFVAMDRLSLKLINTEI